MAKYLTNLILKVHNKIFLLVILAMFVSIFMLANILLNSLTTNIRFDLTKQKTFTLSTGTNEILSKIQEPIQIKFFFSKTAAKDYPLIDNFANRVRDLLQQYQIMAKGKLRIEYCYIEPFSELEDLANSEGITAIPIDNNGSVLFMGIVAVNAQLEKLTIPILRPNQEQTLEYELTRIIAKLMNQPMATIGILSSVPLQGQLEIGEINSGQYAATPWPIYEQLKDNFKVEYLANDITVIPEHIDTMLAVGVNNLTKNALNALNMAVTSGKPAMVLLDPYIESVDPDVFLMHKGAIVEPYDLDLVLKSWGIEFSHAQVIASRANAKLIHYKENTQDQEIAYPIWIDIDRSTINTQDPVTKSLDKVSFATAGAINPIANASTIVTPLITTKDSAMLLPANKIQDYQNNPRALLADYNYENKYTLAVRIKGNNVNVDHKNINLIVIADVDFIHEHFWLTKQNVFGQIVKVPFNSNANLIINCLENLSGNDAFIGIRNKAIFANSFTKINEFMEQAEMIYRLKETELLDQIKATNTDLNTLEAKMVKVSDIQTAILYKQTQSKLSTQVALLQKELRQLRHSITVSISNIETRLKFLTIFLMPLLVTVVYIVIWVVNSKQQSKIFIQTSG